MDKTPIRFWRRQTCLAMDEINLNHYSEIKSYKRNLYYELYTLDPQKALEKTVIQLKIVSILGLYSIFDTWGKIKSLVRSDSESLFSS